MYISLSLLLSFPFSPLSSVFLPLLYSSSPWCFAGRESPAVPDETNGDRERHGKAPAFKDLKGGDRERE